MASFSAEYYYFVADATPNYITTNPPMAAGNVSFYKADDPNATEFTVGDNLDFNVDGLPSGAPPMAYLGSYDGGIVLWNSGVGAAMLFSNTDYPVGTTFELNTDPFPVCFVKGSQITTSRGPVAIEDLVEGDLVQGSSGWRTVKWVGWRNYGPASFLTPESKARIAPVRIRAHAIAEDVPSSDLLVSPWHHVFVEGKLVRAGDLVNGKTIVQETHVTEVAYHHVELDQFDVVMAHGVYSESWADGGNRNFFQNVDVTSLRPEDTKRRRAPRPGFDDLVLRKGKELSAIQRNVAQRAETMLSSESNTRKAA